MDAEEDIESRGAMDIALRGSSCWRQRQRHLSCWAHLRLATALSLLVLDDRGAVFWNHSQKRHSVPEQRCLRCLLLKGLCSAAQADPRRWDQPQRSACRSGGAVRLLETVGAAAPVPPRHCWPPQ